MNRRRFVYNAALGLVVPFTGRIIKAASPIPVTPSIGIVVAAGCSTQQLDVSGTNTNNFNVGSGSSRALGAGRFASPGAVSICRIDLPLYKSGSPTMDLFVSIYNDTSTEPGTMQSAESAAVNAATLPAADPVAGGSWTTWTITPYALSAATNYFVVVRTSAQDAGNFCIWPCIGGNGTGLGMTWNGSIWSTEVSRQPGLRLFST